MSRLRDAEKFLEQQFAEAGLSARHSLEVLRILRQDFHVTDEDILVAGLLHDLWEDTPTEWPEIEEKFGPQVTALIKEVSHPRNPTKEDYKNYHESLKTVSNEAKLIKLADQLYKLNWTEKMLERSEKVAKYHIDVTEEILGGCNEVEQSSLVEAKLNQLKGEMKGTF